ncbi:MAG: RNA polymerase sigma factor [Bacteroidaceae bacterium]|nr:RNA polymerase sigma factor [Bacteroidaceae bacterium]
MLLHPVFLRPKTQNQPIVDELNSRLLDPNTRRAAFEETVRLYGPQLYRHIRSMVLTHDDADDVMQETFLKAWAALDQFKGEAKVSTWLYRIATNESLSFLSRRRSSVALEDTDVERTLQSDPYFDGDELQLQLQKAIATLPDKQRLVFNMKYYQQMKYEEMSEILNTSVGALKASYHIAVKKIETFFNNRD